MRENLGEIDLAAQHKLPQLITTEDIQGDVHMHTVETDGRNTIEEMAEAARAHGYKYMAITDHSKNLAFANGLDDQRALAHIKRIREAGNRTKELGSLPELKSTFWATDRSISPTDVLGANGHRYRQRALALQSGIATQMTERLLKAIANPNTSILGHPTGRQLLRRDGYPSTWTQS